MKRSQRAAVEANIKNTASRSLANRRDFSKLERFPSSPPLAFYYRRYADLRSALRACLADRSAKPGDPRSMKAERYSKTGIRAMLNALGDDGLDYVACGRAFGKWMDDTERQTGVPSRRFTPNHEDYRVCGAWDVAFWLNPLIVAFKNPKLFFENFAPSRDSNRLFERHNLFTELGSVDRIRLGQVLATWGFGATLNPEVRNAMDSASPKELVLALAYAERRGVFREGRPKGSKDQKPRPPRASKYDERFKDELANEANQIEHESRRSRGGVKTAIRRRARVLKVSPVTIRTAYYRKRKK